MPVPIQRCVSCGAVCVDLWRPTPNRQTLTPNCQQLMVNRRPVDAGICLWVFYDRMAGFVRRLLCAAIILFRPLGAWGVPRLRPDNPPPPVPPPPREVRTSPIQPPKLGCWDQTPQGVKFFSKPHFCGFKMISATRGSFWGIYILGYPGPQPSGRTPPPPHRDQKVKRRGGGVRI